MGEREIKVIPAIRYAEDWSEIDRLDVTLEAFMTRMDSLIQLLEGTGTLSTDEARAALSGFFFPEQIKAGQDGLDQIKAAQNGLDQDGLDVVFEATEIAANWARKELARLRQFEREAREDRSKQTETPVLHGNIIGRAILTDLAITLLTSVEEPGDNLTMLLVELMNVDLHRKTLAEKKSNPAYDLAAQIVAQIPDMMPAQLAKAVGRDKSTISRWMKKPEFKNRVEMFQRVFSSDNPFKKLRGKTQKLE